MALVDSIVVFVVSLLVGAAGIYLGARFVVDEADYSYAVVTALVGAAVWVVVAALFGWIPFLGPLLALVAYVAVVNWRYRGGWGAAAAIAVVAWLASLAILWVLAALGVVAFSALGVPGA